VFSLVGKHLLQALQLQYVSPSSHGILLLLLCLQYFSNAVLQVHIGLYVCGLNQSIVIDWFNYCELTFIETRNTLLIIIQFKI